MNTVARAISSSPRHSVRTYGLQTPAAIRISNYTRLHCTHRRSEPCIDDRYITQVREAFVVPRQLLHIELGDALVAIEQPTAALVLEKQLGGFETARRR